MQFLLSSYTRTSLRSLASILKPGAAMEMYLGQSRTLPYATASRCLSSDGRSKKPKAVIFDMGGVILPSPLVLFAEFESQTGLTKGTLNRLVVSGGADGPWAQLENGKLTLKQFTVLFSQQLSQQVGRDIDVSPLVAKLTFKESSASPVMLDAISCVRAEGMKIALLTNNWFSDELKTKTFLPLDKSLFDVVVESCVLGCRKPHVGMYSRCVEELKVNADETVFLDDIGANLKAARALGIRTIKVVSPEQGVADLEQLLGIPLRGFVPGTTSVPKHLRLDSDKLEKYLRSIGLQDHNPPNIRVFEHGQSNPTYFIGYGGRSIVLRKKPPGKLLPSAHAVDREFRVMSAAQKGGVPVPNMIAYCEDESVIGTQFYLMDFVTGRISKDIRLLELPRESRRETIMAMIRVLARIHAMDIDKVGLSDYGKKGKFVERNFRRWASQYELAKTHEIPSMTKLMEWLPRHMPQTEKVTVVHGDFRLDNLIYHPDKPEVIAAIDWELSTLGDPLTDLATCALVYYLPASCPLMYGLADQDVNKMGIPTVEEIVAEYCRLCNIPSIDNWDFYVAFAQFRMAAILQGVYKRNISGQGSSSIGKTVGAFAETAADIGWRVASQSRLKPTLVPSQTSASEPTNTRSYSTLAAGRHHTAAQRKSALATESDLAGDQAEVIFEGARVPAVDILLGGGHGSEVAQGTLGAASIQCWMRIVGYAGRILNLVEGTVLSETQFRTSLVDGRSVEEDVVKSKAEVEQCRLIVLQAARRVDRCGISEADISAVRAAVRNMVHNVIDRAVQAHRETDAHNNLPLAHNNLPPAHNNLSLAHLLSEVCSLKNDVDLDEALQKAVARLEFAKSTTAKL